MTTNLLPAKCCAIALVALTSACDDGDGPARPGLPYAPNETVVIGPDGTETAPTPSGDACVELASGECVRPQSKCGEFAYADVVLDRDGKVIEIVCLPSEQDTPIVHVDDGVAVVPDNGAVVVLDGRVLEADLSVEGNRGILYGDSPEEAVIDGNLTLRGNESTVRGITVTGNVTFDGNTAELYYCVVYGDVLLKGNKNFVSNCTIFGSVLGSGNEDTVIGNMVDGNIEFSGFPAECRDNHRFEDTDGDHALDEDEAAAAAPLECKKR